uniref:Patched 2 n=1 Tax=Monodelphis domestica TaxID=13616 RepID=A0A5F8HCG1_MONDO
MFSFSRGSYHSIPPSHWPPLLPHYLGGRAPLWLRAHVGSLLFGLGCAIQRHCGKVLFVGLLAFGALALGLRGAAVETDLERLWVEVGSRVSQELRYTKEKLGEEAVYTSQTLIQTARHASENILTPEALGLHLQATLAASKVQVSLYGKSWDLNKICYKAGVPVIENGMIERMIEKLFPCVILTPLDCFWEGAKLQGGSAYLPGRPDIQWTNLDPEQLLEELGPFASLEGFRELLDKAQVGQAYVGRPCLHPDDPHCPASAPNHHSRQVPDVARELSGGCHGFSRKFMHWQEELLLGSPVRSPQGRLLSAEALQSTFLLMSPRQLYDHYRGDYETHDISWSEAQAGAVLQAWQRRFVELAQQSVPQNASQQIHAFSATTLDDLLRSFSDISAVRVAGGYLLMLAYACVTMLRWDCSKSQGAVGLAGVLLVALSVASGLGLCSLLGMTFNAATTQVLPFLALGIGVDDMFLLAHAFTEAPPGTPLQERTGECLQRMGTSVVLTSVNNLVAFFMAALVPIPALRAFSLQAAVVVSCNFTAVLLIFPAILSLDLHRRHRQRLDVLCCFSSPCSSRVIQIQPPELGESQMARGGAHLTTTVQAFARCDTAGQHVVTILPPTTHLAPLPTEPLGSQLFGPVGSTRDLLGQVAGPGRGQVCRPLPCARWNLSRFARCQYAPLLLQPRTKVQRGTPWAWLTRLGAEQLGHLEPLPHSPPRAAPPPGQTPLLPPQRSPVSPQVLVLAMMTVELFGIMGFLGIKLSAIPVVILVASVGIGVEFTAHVALGFLTATGSRDARSAQALEHMFAPVMDGAVSTLLGLLMLAGSDFDFIVRYFFVVLTVLTGLGLLHGLVLLPVLLSILGPPAQVVQTYKDSPPGPGLPPLTASGGAEARWGPHASPGAFTTLTASVTVALHPPPLPGSYVQEVSEEPKGPGARC